MGGGHSEAFRCCGGEVLEHFPKVSCQTEGTASRPELFRLSARATASSTVSFVCLLTSQGLVAPARHSGAGQDQNVATISRVGKAGLGEAK